MPDERESTERVDQRSRAPTFANLKLQTHNKVVKVFESQRGFSLLVCSLGARFLDLEFWTSSAAIDREMRLPRRPQRWSAQGRKFCPEAPAGGLDSGFFRFLLVSSDLNRFKTSWDTTPLGLINFEKRILSSAILIDI